MISESRDHVLLHLDDGSYVEFSAYPEHGAWYEHRQTEPYGPWVKPGSAGTLMMPMLANGDPDLAGLCEIIEPIQ